jgi:uncharacterized protein (TIGR02246 family)
MSPASTTGESRAETPQQVIELFSHHLNSGNLDGALSLYEREAVFAPQPGQLVFALKAIREALAGFFALRPRIEGEIQGVLEAGGIALVINKWSLSGTQPDGQPLAMAGTSADVLRRQQDGRWLIVIDNLWGA